jgi:predicted transcriptional regulator
MPVAKGRGDLRKRRQALGLSLERLAATAQVSCRTIERVERGVHQGTPSTIAAIEWALEQAESQNGSAA